MTGTITDDKYYEDHAALLGRVALAWNDCHYVVLSIFHTLSGVSWSKACAIFFALKSDHDRREIALALMKEVLNTENDRRMRELGTQLFGRLAGLAGERNAATHTMWASVMPDGEVQPHPALPRPKVLKDNVRAQFSELTTELRNLFRELWLYQSALWEHLE
jgi:hypothetical protein